MLSHTGPAQASFLDLKRPEPVSDKSFFLCLPLHSHLLPGLPHLQGMEMFDSSCSSGFSLHFSLFHFQVLQVLSSEGNSHLGTITWSVRGRINVGKVQQNRFSGRLIAQVLSHKCLTWVLFSPVIPSLTEQGIFGIVIPKLPIGSLVMGTRSMGRMGRKQPALPTVGEEFIQCKSHL